MQPPALVYSADKPLTTSNINRLKTGYSPTQELLRAEIKSANTEVVIGNKLDNSKATIMWWTTHC